MTTMNFTKQEMIQFSEHGKFYYLKNRDSKHWLPVDPVPGEDYPRPFTFTKLREGDALPVSPDDVLVQRYLDSMKS